MLSVTLLLSSITDSDTVILIVSVSDSTNKTPGLPFSLYSLYLICWPYLPSVPL